MTMSFEESLQTVCNNIIPHSKDCQSYNDDAEKIRNCLMEKMKKHDSTFRDAFDGLSLGGSYLDRLKINFPDEFDYHIKLKMPFKIVPREDYKRAGFITLYVPPNFGEVHPIIRHSHVSRQCLQNWIRNLLSSTISEGIRLSVNGRIYLIEYPRWGRGYAVAHTIWAKEEGLGGLGEREISFDFVPAFEFSPHEWPLKCLDKIGGQSWLAIPFGKRFRNCNKIQPDEFTFMTCAPRWEHEVLHNKQNLKNSLRLMKALRNANKLGLLTSYMLKTIYLWEIDVRPDWFWQQPMGTILIEMIKVLLQALREKDLPYFFDKDINNLNLVKGETTEEYVEILHNIAKKLCDFQKQSNVNYDDIAALFICKKKF